MSEMKINAQIMRGALLTIAIYSLAIFIGGEIKINIQFISHSFMTHSLMISLSLMCIYFLKEHVNYKIALPSIKRALKPILLGLVDAIVATSLLIVITNIENTTDENIFGEASPLQNFIFVFIYASIAEEVLFRGFFQNILKPLSGKGLYIFNRKISIPVIVSAIAFGLGHLILITTGASFLFLLTIVVYTTIGGLIAGYYQEKYDNNAYAIIAHMAGNSMIIVELICNCF